MTKFIKALKITIILLPLYLGSISAFCSVVRARNHVRARRISHEVRYSIPDKYYDENVRYYIHYAQQRSREEKWPKHDWFDLSSYEYRKIVGFFGIPSIIFVFISMPGWWYKGLPKFRIFRVINIWIGFLNFFFVSGGLVR